MTQEQKRKCARLAALPMALLAVCGLYFGARAVADHQFSAAFRSASEYTAEQRGGLWNFNGLSGREQQLYVMLEDAMAERGEKTQRTFFVPTEEEFTAAFDAVLYDNPLYCDLIRAECALVAGDDSAYITLSYLDDGDARRQQLQAYAKTAADAVSSLSDAESALYFNDLIVGSCAYSDESSDVRSTAYDAALLGRADSYGYALLYALLCREAGLDCAVVRGTVQTLEQAGDHAWNVLALDGATGYTDVMWNDTEGPDGLCLPFHGYYFLSSDEISADHTPLAGLCFPTDGNTQNYYESQDLCITDAAALDGTLQSLLTDARHRGAEAVELWLDPARGITDYALEIAISAAIDAANAGGNAPQLRQVHRVYRSSANGGGVTVLLFYEENDEQSGET
ncbi:MAG: hypothetical protein IKZ09_04130 [Clostridia bacterium]|nr:hypothetical protein [Clostridia bacterium]